MLGTNQRKKDGPIKSCLIPLLGLVGFIAGCYLLCAGLFVLNGGQLSFAAPPVPTVIPIEVPTPEATPTPVSYFHHPSAATYRFQATSYSLTLVNTRS